MSLFNDNAIFSGLLVSPTMNQFLCTTHNIFFHVITLLTHHLFSEEKRSPRVGLVETPFWQCRAASQPHKAQQALMPTLPPLSLPLSLSGLLSVSRCQQTMCPSLCPSSQLWESALGLCTECSVQSRSLYFTPQL